MHELKGRHIISELQKKWTIRILLAHLVFVLAITLFSSAIAIRVFHVSWVCIPVMFFLFSLLSFRFIYKNLTEEDVSKFLNITFTELQESTGLLLKPYADLNLLEKLQVHTVEQVITENVRQPKRIARQLRTSFILLLAAFLACLVLFVVPVNLKETDTSTPGNNSSLVRRETKLPQVDEVSIQVTPPAYTGKRVREQDKFNVVVEEGGNLFWHISTTSEVEGVQLIFNDKSVLQLQPVNKNYTRWSTHKQVRSSGFYQVQIGSSLSELYQLEMIKDQPPVIVVQFPKPNTVIAPWEPQSSPLTVSLSDDYGIKNTFISATISSGSGEAVRFKEQQLAFANFKSGADKYKLQKQIDLRLLGMKPGDELYFYVSATDTYNQEKRSDIYIVKIEDTAQLMSLEGLASGINIKPEFFRSQRQIIIETEQLLKDQDKISTDEFAKRSNDLGVDQKLLRLRYGKFLGEETDVEIGKDPDHAEEGSSVTDLGNAEKMMDEVSHKHDNAEDATFFDAQTKKQLKATLAEMWKAELQLRTNKPKEALPFEYIALKLLKELQQQTRVYVAKTGIRTTPLKPEKRLTGELGKIIQPVQQQNFLQGPDETMIQRKALGILEQVRNKEIIQGPSREILEQAGVHLSMKAAAEPATYLSALEAYRRILKNVHTPADLSLAGSALQQMIRAASRLPRPSGTSPDMQLSQRYFRNLNRRND